MNSKQKRKKRRKASNNNIPVPPNFNLVNVTNDLYRLSEDSGIGLSKILCGYGRAPIYANITDDLIDLLHVCALKPGYMCRYQSPHQTRITDSCAIYKAKFEK